MKADLINTHLLVPRSRSSAKVKVKYQGHVSQKMGASGALVFHKHILFHGVFFPFSPSENFVGERKTAGNQRFLYFSKFLTFFPTNHNLSHVQACTKGQNLRYIQIESICG